MLLGKEGRCLCRSGKPYKLCCGRKSRQFPELPEEISNELSVWLSDRETREKLRKIQQGHGKPIISVELHDYRIVFVGNRVLQSKTWMLFTDFLFHFLKEKMNFEWGKRESKNPRSGHSIFRWLNKLQLDKVKNPSTEKIRSSPKFGYIACLLHLGYALYLIDHHDSVPKLLLKRLRDEVKFLPAYYEAMVGAALAVAGFELQCEETVHTSKPTPEFSARSKTTGRVYEVEAKRKEGWSNPCDLAGEGFFKELESYVKRQIKALEKKKLKNPILWIELSIPTIKTESDWRLIIRFLANALNQEEALPIEKRISNVSTPIIFTNYSFLTKEDATHCPIFAALEAFNVSGFSHVGWRNIEASLDFYDEHRDIFWMLESIKYTANVPETFDGTPVELLGSDGKKLKL